MFTYFTQNSGWRHMFRYLRHYQLTSPLSPIQFEFGSPNAVLYTLDQHVVELGALMLRFYPAVANAALGSYINNAGYAQAVKEFKLDNGLVAAVERTGRIPTAGDVKMMYYTRSGPGPQVLGQEDAIIDPLTGLNTYRP